MVVRRFLGRTAVAVTAGAVVAVLGADALRGQGRREPTPVRQNPNVDRPITNEGFDSAVIDLLQRLVAAYGPIADSNDKPNPYTRIEPFGEPPPGNNGEWAAVIAAEGGPDGRLYVLHRCHDNSCVDRPETAGHRARPEHGPAARRVGRGPDGVSARPPS